MANIRENAVLATCDMHRVRLQVELWPGPSQVWHQYPRLPRLSCLPRLPQQLLQQHQQSHLPQQLPKHQITAWTRYDLTERFGLGLGVVYQDEQFASFSGNVVLPDYVRVDSAAYFDVNDRLSFQLNIENLFDANYYPSAHGDNNIQPGDPFTARLGVRIKI